MQLGELYESDCIFDKFDCCFSGDGSHIATGTYSNSFRMVGRGDVNGGMPSSDTVLEASRDPQRKRFQQTPTKVRRPCILAVCCAASVWSSDFHFSRPQNRALHWPWSTAPVLVLRMSGCLG